MLDRNLLGNRADRVIATARLFLAAVTLGISLVDPPLPLVTSGIVIRLLVAYLGFAAVMMAWMFARPLWARQVGTWPHGVDLGLVAALIYLTTGSASPFFTLYLFVILASTLKWDARGAFWTTGIVALLFLPSAFMRIDGIEPATPGETLRFVMRLLQVLVCGALLVLIGRQRERAWRELIKLAQPITRGDGRIDDSIGYCLAHVRQFFALDRAIIAWEYLEEPGWRALQHVGGRVAALPIDPDGGPLAFLPADLVMTPRPGATGSLALQPDGSISACPTELPETLLQRWQIADAIVATIRTDAVQAVLVLSRHAAASDFHLVRALAVQIAATLENAVAALAWRAAAASEERLRLARNLHDGVLQFLTGLALQLQLLRRKADDPAMVDRIAALEDALRVERADMRAFVDRATGDADGPGLAEFCSVLARQWDVEILADRVAEPPAAMALHVRQIIREGVANAVRHGGAGQLRLSASTADDRYQLTLIDNGCGLSRHGRFDDVALRHGGFGPRSILDRVDRLGGAVALESMPSGVTLTITIPLAQVLAA